MSEPAGSSRRRVSTCTVTRDGPHLQIVVDDEVDSRAPFQEFGNDVVAKGSRFQQSAGDLFLNVDFGNPPCDHYAAHAVVTALEEFDIRREILGNPIIAGHCTSGICRVNQLLCADTENA